MQQALPPELWRECIRWATLPPLGRLPLNDPPTCLSPWTPGCLAQGAFEEAADYSHAYEQHQIYPRKRALMLVCKAWTELAIEFLYESILVDMFGIGSAEKFVAVLRTPGRGSQFAWWVNRVDMNSRIKDHILTIQKLCPNLHVFNMFNGDHNNQGHYLAHLPFLHPESRLTTLSVTPVTLSTIFETSPSTLGHLRYLTIIVENNAGLWGSISIPIIPPLPQLISLTAVVLDWNGTAPFVPIESWSCPCLTHLTIHFWNDLKDVSGVVEHFGSQLTFFAFTLTEPYTSPFTMYSFLKAMPNLKELVTPQLFPRITHAELGPLQGFSHPNIEVLGFPVHSIPAHQVDGFSAEYVQRIYILFPKLRAVRITSAQRGYSAAYCQKNPDQDRLKHLQMFASILEGFKIVLEDPTGQDVRHYILEAGKLCLPMQSSQ